MSDVDQTDLAALMQRIRDQARTDNIRITQHAHQEMVEYEQKTIVHTVRFRGQTMVIDNVPAEICPVCGDVLLSPDTVRQIETLLRTSAAPVRMIPMYEYA